MKNLLLPLFVLIYAFAGAQSVDSAQLMKDVSILSSDKMEGRMVGTKGSREAQLYIIQRFEQIGLEKKNNTYEQSFFFSNNGERIMGTNIMGYLPGKLNDWIVISAHYDHLGIAKNPVNGDSIYNGADDNASGVAGLLAIASYFKQHRPQHNLLFVAFDAEEEGLQGSKAFIDQSKDIIKNIRLNINMDMISHSSAHELYACGTHQFPKLKPFLEKADSNANAKLLLGHDDPNQGKDNWVNQSDQGSFYAVGIPFIYFGVEDHPDYHRVTDEFKTITPAFFYGAVQLIIKATQNLDRYMGVYVPPRSKWIMQEKKGPATTGTH